jgi:hypothetical protein
MIQWHPIFAKLIRPLLQDYFEILTNVPVGDVPREADIVLLRRTSEGRLPFREIWKHLTQWNILEFKSPNVSARIEDLPTFIEVALGVNRRFNEDRRRQRKIAIAPADVSFWYLANHLGKRYYQGAERKLPGLERIQDGIHKCSLLEHPVYLVSRADLTVNDESVPLHILAREPADKEREVAALVASQPSLLRAYAESLATLHPQYTEELRNMAKTRTKTFGFNFEPLVEILGWEEVVRQLGRERLIQYFGEKKIVEQMDVERLLASLSPSQRREMKRRLENS